MSSSKNHTSKRQKLETNNGKFPAETVPTCVRIDYNPKRVIDNLQTRIDLDEFSLQSLLRPFSADEFMKSCFRQCAVHIVDRHNDERHPKDPNAPHRLHSICSAFFDLDPPTILRETSSENIFVWLQKNHSAGVNGNKLIHSIEISDPDTALHLYEAGNATYCRAPAELEQTLVRALLRDTGLGCGQYDPTGQRITSMGRGEVEVFQSSTAGHVTNWHYDFQENFTLQLSGIKRWTVQKGTVRHPIRGCTPHYNAPEAVESQMLAARLADPTFVFGEPTVGQNAVGPIETVDLHPGDVFYFPAGMWHKVEVLEPGVSINISLMATNYANVFCQALQHVLLKNDAWRQCVRNEGTSAIDDLNSLIKTLPDIIRKFEKNGGAKLAFPPAVLHGETVAKSSVNDKDDSEEDEELEDDDHDSVVIAANFQGPVHQGRGNQNNNQRYIINPLAVLLDERKEIENYYNTIRGAERTEDDSDTAVYILNINYAGNEANESVLRVRIAAPRSSIQEIQSRLAQQNQCFSKSFLQRNQGLIDCLVHYGYLLRLEK